MKYKKLSILFTLMLALSSFFSSIAFAENNDKPNLVALGDSITFGWNLEGNNSQPSLKAFPYLIANGAFDVTNISGGGWTSAMILTKLNDPANADAIKNADAFTLAIGSNDLMQAVGLSEIIQNGTPVDPNVLQPKVLAASAQLSQNLQGIFTKIRTLNPNAPIVFYNLYNPFGPSDVPFQAFLHSIGEQIVTSVNTSVLAPFATTPGVIPVDAYSNFNNKQATLIIPGDIHPTLTGQAVLAGLATPALVALIPKEIVIDLTATPTEETAGPITIEVLTNAEEIVAIKWLVGEKAPADFIEAGTDIIDHKFEVTENGIYTVYVRDAKGTEAVKSITIENIKVDEPKKENPDPIKNGTDNKPAPTPKAPAAKGHRLPDTASPAYNYLAIGSAVMLAGFAWLNIEKRRRKKV